jgi:hypothetical protein
LALRKTPSSTLVTNTHTVTQTPRPPSRPASRPVRFATSTTRCNRSIPTRPLPLVNHHTRFNTTHQLFVPPRSFIVSSTNLVSKHER